MSLVHDILHLYPLPAGLPVRALRGEAGFSGAGVWKIGERWCLKATPQTGSIDHDWIHAQLLRAARAGLVHVPVMLPSLSGQTFVEHGGYIWELMNWLPGRADFHERPSRVRLESACASLARLHRAWATDRHGPCPALRRRLDTVERWLRLCREGWQPAPEAASPLREVASRLWTMLQNLVPRVPERLLPLMEMRVPLQPCLCDIWHDNVLFAGDEVTGIVDFASMKVDNVAVDLARLLGSLVPERDELWTAGLNAYNRLRPLHLTEETLIPVLEESGAILAAANWLMWLYHDGREYTNRSAVLKRLGELEARLQML